jgi:hypothetical protein
MSRKWNVTFVNRGKSVEEVKTIKLPKKYENDIASVARYCQDANKVPANFLIHSIEPIFEEEPEEVEEEELEDE